MRRCQTVACVVAGVLASCTLAGSSWGQQAHGRLAYRPEFLTLEHASLRAFASKHYVIHTDLAREDAVPFGRHMDAVYAEYARRFAAFGSASQGGREAAPMPLYLFRSREGYIRFLESQGIRAEHSGGMFFVNPARSGLATWTEGHARRDTLATLQHEGFHQFAWERISKDLPTWLNEGLAQYFEDAPLVNGRLVTGPMDGTRLLRVQESLRTGRAMGLSELMSLDAAHWSAALNGDLSHSGLLYAQSWSVVYFLIHGEGGLHRGALVDYLHDLSRGRPAEVSFEARFGKGGALALQRGWERAVVALSPTALDHAEERLEFFAAAARLYDERGWPMPVSVEAWRDQLRSIEFAVVRREDDITRTLRSMDDTLFAFSDGRGGDGKRFTFVASARPDLPPSIRAPGLSPEPMLVWSRSRDGELSHEVVYR